MSQNNDIKKKSNKVVADFNKILQMFLDQVESHIGSTYHFMITQYISLCGDSPIEQFLVYALPLREKIMTRDESYFNDCSNYKDQIQDDNTLITHIVKMQSIYKDLDAESKSSIWDIIQALLILGEEYITINKDKFTK